LAGGEVGLRSIPLIDLGQAGPMALLDADRTRADDILAIARRRYSSPVLRIGDQLSRTWLERTGKPYLGELDTIATRFEHPGVYILNLSHEWFCTSAVVPAPGGGMRLLRSLDWPIEGFGRNVVVAKHEKPAGIYYNFTWPGFLGSANGIAPGRFAVAINQAPIHRRLMPVAVSRMLHRREIWRRGGLPPPHLLRQVFETCETYADAKRMLTETPVCAPVIFSLAGAGDNEGCIIQRLPDQAGVLEGAGCIANHWQTDDLTRHHGRPDSYDRYVTMERKLRERPSDRPPSSGPGGMLVQSWPLR
jgi:hypothetical protein